MPVAVTETQQLPESEESFTSRLWYALRIYALAVFGFMFLVALYFDATQGHGDLPIAVERLLVLFVFVTSDVVWIIRERVGRARMGKESSSED